MSYEEISHTWVPDPRPKPCPECERLRQELAEARAALAKDAPIAQAVRDWWAADQAYKNTRGRAPYRHLAAAADDAWERLLAVAAGQAAEEAE